MISSHKRPWALLKTSENKKVLFSLMIQLLKQVACPPANSKGYPYSGVYMPMDSKQAMWHILDAP